jgi:hypothetical protein
MRVEGFLSMHEAISLMFHNQNEYDFNDIIKLLARTRGGTRDT